MDPSESAPHPAKFTCKPSWILVAVTERSNTAVGAELLGVELFTTRIALALADQTELLSWTANEIV